MDFVALPHQGIDRISLGVSRDEVIRCLGPQFTVFKRFPDDPDTLAYDLIGLHLELDESGRLTKIGVFRPNRIVLGVVQLLDRSIDELFIELENSNLHFEKVDAGLWSQSLALLCVECNGRTDGVEIGVVSLRG